MELTQTFAHQTKLNVTWKSNNLAIVHNRTFEKRSFTNCTPIKFHLVSNRVLLLINKLYVSFNFMSEMSRDAEESRDSGKRQTDRETNRLKATTGAFFAVGVDVIKYQNNV